MLSIEGVSVGYGGPRPAVDDVSLEVATGEVVALLGPSGCGKSSLLRAVAGLEPLLAGAVRWDGEDLADVPVHRRGFGLMFQEGQLFEHRDVAGNVAFGLEMTGRRDRSRVAELLDLVGLAGYERRPVRTLSGGEQQRVALARALAPQPRLLLLDEPLSALDRRLREHLAVEVADILRATGTTALYVTHDHDEAFTVADRVALMRAGSLVQVGTPAQLWAAPADAEAAAFLGYRLVDDDDGVLALGPRALRVAAADEEPVAHGVVTGLTFSRGEAVALVDVPGWGEVRALVGDSGSTGGSAAGHTAGTGGPGPGDTVGLVLARSETTRVPPTH